MEIEDKLDDFEIDEIITDIVAKRIRVMQTKKVFDVLAELISKGETCTYRYLIYDLLGFEGFYAELISGLTITNMLVDYEDMKDELGKTKLGYKLIYNRCVSHEKYRLRCIKLVDAIKRGKYKILKSEGDGEYTPANREFMDILKGLDLEENDDDGSAKKSE